MKSPPYRRLLRVLTGSSPSKLYQQVQFLEAENEVLRARIQGPIGVTARERYRLVRLARPLGSAVRELSRSRRLDQFTSVPSVPYHKTRDERREQEHSSQNRGPRVTFPSRFFVQDPQTRE